MKIRLGFVANSSSSSFVCDVCGNTETGYSCGPSDFEMSYCENEHLMCNEHALHDETIDDDDYGSVIPESACPICQMQIYSQSEMVKYLQKTRNVSWGEVFEQIKSVNKRRKKLYNFEYIKEVFTRYELTEDSIMDEIRTKFKNYGEYRDFLYGRDTDED